MCPAGRPAHGSQHRGARLQHNAAPKSAKDTVCLGAKIEPAPASGTRVPMALRRGHNRSGLPCGCVINFIHNISFVRLTVASISCIMDSVSFIDPKISISRFAGMERMLNMLKEIVKRNGVVVPFDAKKSQERHL